ncbi:MAG: NAD(+)/NADH kinase [Deltaproteobacteria bacterium]|nr:NAD(+)/NADH kinase [Deltaproteobacteria bacterium]
MKKIALVVKWHDENAHEFATVLASWLSTMGYMVLCESPSSIPYAQGVDSDELVSTSEVMIVLGGDGTLLHAASLMQKTVIPVIGINMGSLGFLTPFTSRNCRTGIEAALQGKLKKAPRARLDTRLLRNNNEIFRTLASNDVVINHDKMARLMEIHCHVDDAFVASYKSDGLIVSTPMGSTAYALAAGGPVLSPEMDAVSIVPICPHQLTQRPMVIPSSSCLSVKVHQKAFLTVDGQRGCVVQPDDLILISESLKPLMVFLPDDYSIFNVLRHKLSWGVRESSDA